MRLDSILLIIRKNKQQLSAQQKAVADYILSNPEESAFLTSSQLAASSGTSDATVLRFVNRLGLQKYAELQNALRALVRGKLTQSQRLQRRDDKGRQGEMLQTVIQSMHTDINSIERTMASLQEEDLEAVVTALATSRKVYVVGSHSEYGIACYIASTLGWIRDNVSLLDETHKPTFDSLARSTDRDVLVAISFPPYPGATVRFLDAAGRRGVKTIAITDSLLSPLAQRASHCLLTQDVKLFYADNSAPVMSLLSAILALVANQNFEKSSLSLQQMSDYWEEMGFYHREKD